MPTTKETAKLAALDAKVEERHRENQRWQSVMDTKVDVIDNKLDSLLASRSFTKGIWKAVTVIAFSASAIVTFVVTWWKGY